MRQLEETMTLYDCPTPSVVLDKNKLIGNIKHMQEKARANRVQLRPHVKTHKCSAIAALQMKHGATGITVSRPAEALAFLRHGMRSITVAYPLLNQREVEELLHKARTHNARIRFIVDSKEGIDVLIAAAPKEPVDVFLKIDVGLHRCGVAPNSPDVLLLATAIHNSPVLNFTGILSHAGHAYAALDNSAIVRIAQQEFLVLAGVRKQLEEAGIPVREVSAGATPTILAVETFDGLTELRPGNYVFLDATQIRRGICTNTDIALSVLTTIISKNRDYYIIDAGSKTLSSDLGAHGMTAMTTYGMAWTLDSFPRQQDALPIVRLSEEHGFIERLNTDLNIGTRLRIIPNHACPVVNLAAQLYVANDNDVVNIWPVDARNAH